MGELAEPRDNRLNLFSEIHVKRYCLIVAS
jgi:hypothetical protein